MNNSLNCELMKTRRLLLFLFIFQIHPYFTHRLIAETHLIEKPDTTLRFNTLMTGIDYTSNTSAFGRFSGLAKQPSYSGYLLYYLKNGLNFGISPLALGNSDSSATKYTMEYDFNIGYDWKINKYFSISPAYTYYLSSKDSYSLKSLYNQSIQLGLNFTSNYFYANSSVYYLMGNYKEWMNTGLAGGNFQFNKKKKKNHFLTVTPEISYTMSNLDYYNQSAYKTYWYLYLYSGYQKNPTLRIEDLDPNLIQYKRIWRILNNFPQVYKNFMKLDKDLLIADLFKAEKKFNLSSIGINIPVAYTIRNFSISFTYSIIFPINLPEYLDDSPVNYFSTGISYMFSL